LGFLKEELKLRKELEYPPFSRMVNFRFQGRSRDETLKFARVVRETVRKLASKLPLEVIDILGPSPCPVYKVKNWYRWQMLIKSDSLSALHGFSRQLVKVFSEKGLGRIRFFVDVDPLNFL
jgi:primosomal protein N' (replication factor Y)